MCVKLKLNHSLIPMEEVYAFASDVENIQQLSVDRLHKLAKDAYLLSSLALIKIMRDSHQPPKALPKQVDNDEEE